MSSRIKETVDLLAKASGSRPIFPLKKTVKPPIFEVVLELQDGLKTRVQRQISNRVNVNQVIQDVESGTKAKVLQVVQIQ